MVNNIYTLQTIVKWKGDDGGGGGVNGSVRIKGAYMVFVREYCTVTGELTAFVNNSGMLLAVQRERETERERERAQKGT